MGSESAAIASFIVDEDPVFAYAGWILAHSLHLRSGFSWSDIHVQFTPEVSERTVQMFRDAGCTTHRLTRFGDGKYCNKLGQWEALREVEARGIFFLDTDMICLADLKGLVPADAIGGKIVDLDNPPIDTMNAVFAEQGFDDRPERVPAEASGAATYAANCNGGFYWVPRRFAEPLFTSWRRHAEQLLANPETLRQAGKEMHVDQIAFCLAIHETKLPFQHLPSNINYYLHFAGEHAWRDPDRPIALIHYHNSIGMLGMLEPLGATNDEERTAVADANRLIEQTFNTKLFWDFRYDRFPERGSGVGSRGSNLNYKRELLEREGIEQADSILDVGCGDLEVLKSMNLRNYTGIDRSEVSLATASAARPDWTFLSAPAPNASAADMVLCFEVAIHQESAQDYQDLIRFVADKTRRTLIISGYDEPSDEIVRNHMLFFYEPLKQTLERTGKFQSIRPIGKHTTVTVYRCDV